MDDNYVKLQINFIKLNEQVIRIINKISIFFQNEKSINYIEIE